ncbi:MAG TPA: dihydroorotate dehydrogenase-like protein [Tepidisphaeraceae bacterium]|jgi:dihydroorotate dehydrogenase (fumarate)|nr:dihydroorotate dehydrogenase-like protein [Tepidisphaeraceae bacterium]
MDLSTNYLGLRLRSPLMPGASPMVDDLDLVKRLEDAGAGAIVMHSLFEEQINGEHLASIYHMELYADSYAEAISYFPRRSDYALGPEQYLRQIERIKSRVSIPLIGSLNGITPGGWTRYARLIQEAGADALELNTYLVATDPQEDAITVEQRLLEIVRDVARSVDIPVAVKLSPFFSSFANIAYQLDGAGVEGLVLFNRFYQPDIDIENLEVKPTLHLSDSSELLLRLRWVAILARHVSASLAITGGVHTATDAIKAIMVGADAVQIVSELLRHGPERLAVIEREVCQWMRENDYHSLRQMQGSLSLSTCPDPQAFERANYVRTLHSFRPGGPELQR